MLELELLSFKYFHNMFRHWTPDQLTPRASEKNPFNDVPTTPTAVHPLLSSGLSVTSDLTPAQPTTHLSIHAPIFIMQQPPPAKNLIIKPHPPSLPPPPSSSTPPSSKGQIHVKLIQARALNVGTVNARPYVVVQFEQNEFVSRDPTLESDKEVKGSAISLSTCVSSNALSALGAIGSKASYIQDSSKNSKNSKDPSPTSSSTASAKLSSQLLSPLATQQTPSNNFFGRLSAHNPVWKHEVSLYALHSFSLILYQIFIPPSDVTSEASVITFNVYDRAIVDQGFLGTVQIKPVLIHDHTVDQWYKYVLLLLIIIIIIQLLSNISHRLKPFEDEEVSGEIRVQVTYEHYKVRILRIHRCSSRL